MAEHVPGPIATTTVGVQAPPAGAGGGGEYMQLQVALALCSCGVVHGAVDDGGTFGMATFWLGVKFAQLNRWADLELPTIAGAAFEAP